MSVQFCSIYFVTETSISDKHGNFGTLHDWFKVYGNVRKEFGGLQMVGLCLLDNQVEFHLGGSATNGANPCNFSNF